MARGDEYLRRDRDKAVAEDKSGAPGGFQRRNIKNPLMGFHKWMVYNGKSYWNGGFRMENPVKMDDDGWFGWFGDPPFFKKPPDECLKNMLLNQGSGYPSCCDTTKRSLTMILLTIKRRSPQWNAWAWYTTGMSSSPHLHHGTSELISLVAAQWKLRVLRKYLSSCSVIWGNILSLSRSWRGCSRPKTRAAHPRPWWSDRVTVAVAGGGGWWWDVYHLPSQSFEFWGSWRPHQLLRLGVSQRAGHASSKSQSAGQGGRKHITFFRPGQRWILWFAKVGEGAVVGSALE